MKIKHTVRRRTVGKNKLKRSTRKKYTGGGLLSNKKQPVVVRALYDFVSAGPNQISFKKGDIIHVEKMGVPKTWSTGEVKGSGIVGLFPTDYVEHIPLNVATKNPTEQDIDRIIPMHKKFTADQYKTYDKVDPLYPEMQETYTPEMITSIKYYLQEGSLYINPLLLQQSMLKPNSERIEHIKTVDSAFMVAPKVDEPMVVFRGMRTSYPGLNKPDDEITADTFTSTSRLLKPAVNFIGRDECCIYAFLLEKGIPYIDAYTLGLHKDKSRENRVGNTIRPEMEVILPRDLINLRYEGDIKIDREHRHITDGMAKTITDYIKEFQSTEVTHNYISNDIEVPQSNSRTTPSVSGTTRNNIFKKFLSLFSKDKNANNTLDLDKNSNIVIKVVSVYRNEYKSPTPITLKKSLGNYDKKMFDDPTMKEKMKKLMEEFENELK